MSDPSGKAIVKKWFDHLETQLQAEAEHAGLIGHNTSMGDAREFVVKRVLSTFLPKCLTVGKGRVFDSTGKMSNQIDVVIFDDRFPAFRYPDGQALFPVEGVVATLEVKSAWTTDEIIRALNNCKSVSDLSVDLAVPEPLSLIAPAGALADNPRDLLRPRTYCFGFTGLQDYHALHKAIMAWAEPEEEKSSDGTIPPFPQVIVAGGAVAVTLDRTSLVVAQGMAVRQRRGTPVLGVTNSNFRFGWLASSLLHDVDRWLDVSPQHPSLRRSTHRYNPISDYIEEVRKRSDSIMAFVNWVPGPKRQPVTGTELDALFNANRGSGTEAPFPSTPPQEG
jgi:hypothetical protein